MMESELSSFVSAPQKGSYHRHSLFVTPFKDPSIAHAIPISHGRAVSVATVAHTSVDHSIGHANNASNESHTNSPPIGVFPRYSAMPRADDTPNDISNKEFPCRHICGCKRRGSDKTLLSEPRMCSSRGSRYDHEGNASLHPYCSTACPANKFLKLLPDNHHQVHHQQSHSLTVPPSTSRPVSPVSPASVPRSPIYYSPIIAPPASMEQYYTPYPMQIAMPAVTSSTDLSATISGYPSFNKPSIKADGCWMPSVSSVPFTVSMVNSYQHSPPMPINRLVHPFIDNNKLQLPINDYSRPSLSPLTSPASSPPITPRSAADHHEIIDEDDERNPSSMEGYEKKKSGREMMKTSEDGSFDADQLVKIAEDSKKSKQTDMEKSLTPSSVYDNPIRPSSFRRSPRPSLSMIRRNTMIASSPAALSLDPSPSSSSSNSSSSSSPSPLSRKRSNDSDHHNVITIASKRRSMTRSHDFSYSMRRSSSTISTSSDRHDDNECDNALSFLAEAVSLLQ